MLWILIVVTCFEVSTLADAQSERTTSLDEDANNNEPDHPEDSFCAHRVKLTVFIDRVSVPMVSIQGVAGQRAILPCDIQPRHPGDVVTMVLWFKKDKGDPVFSYDARSRQFTKAKFWSATNVWGHRATFRASPPAQLTIQDIRESDEDVYRCRVDFRNSPTRNFKVNFTVIERRQT
ncbi:hypothetical protein M0802_009787 [Mischocyttarus mexicanus]|nr:hypothetical protein M0802_009787 [Mischocyttarus mexicanus]